MAEHEFESAALAGENEYVKDVGNWEIDDTIWKKKAFVENNESEGESAIKTVVIKFREGLPSILSVEVED